MGTEIKTQQEHACCVIIGAGEITDYFGVAERIPPERFIVCADGGLHHCEGIGVQADLLVGDLDSVGRWNGDIPVVKLPADKDYTDTDHAVEEAEKRGFTEFLLCGVLGGRLDHTLANLQTLARLTKMGHYASITDGRTDIFGLAAAGEQRELWVMPREGCYFSVLSMVDACEGVTIQGGKYPLREYPLSSMEARAVSNEFIGKPVRITMKNGVLLVVVTPMDR